MRSCASSDLNRGNHLLLKFFSHNLLDLNFQESQLDLSPITLIKYFDCDIFFLHVLCHRKLNAIIPLWAEVVLNGCCLVHVLAHSEGHIAVWLHPILLEVLPLVEGEADGARREVFFCICSLG